MSLYSREDIQESMGSLMPPQASDDDSSPLADMDESVYPHYEDDDGLPPEDWVSWMAWKVQTSVRWLKSFVTDDDHNEL